jgi:hypothetical protein
MSANVIGAATRSAATIKDAPAEIPSAATLAALDDLGSPITAASVSARRCRTLDCVVSVAEPIRGWDIWLNVAGGVGCTSELRLRG